MVRVPREIHTKVVVKSRMEFERASLPRVHLKPTVKQPSGHYKVGTSKSVAGPPAKANKEPSTMRWRLTAPTTERFYASIVSGGSTLKPNDVVYEPLYSI